MKNYIQPGDSLTIPAPSGGVVSGGVVNAGAITGIATKTAAVGEPVAIKTSGVFELPKVSAQAWTLGALIYWDGTAGNATTTSTSNTLIGVATEAAANPSAVGRVKLIQRVA